MAFKGLPAPGAAGTLISVVLLYEGVLRHTWPGISKSYAMIMPWLIIGLGLLMVSRLPYVHMVNRFLRGKKPFWALVSAVLGVLAFLLWPEVVLAVVLCGYALSGPLARLIELRRSKSAEPMEPPQQKEEKKS
jgi:CDP-diacylglycerol--serine O-phosphatidyltransferase